MHLVQTQMIPGLLPLQSRIQVFHMAQVEARDAVVDIVKAVFRQHGAAAMESAALGRAPEAPSPEAICLLSRDGTRLALRHELRRPFAAWLARQACDVCIGMTLVPVCMPMTSQ